jgi:hypothetical protein
LTTVAKQFREARREASLPEPLVLYCGRHTFATAAYEATGNLAALMNGHGPHGRSDLDAIPTSGIEPIREAIDQRNLRHNSRHSEVRVQ